MDRSFSRPPRVLQALFLGGRPPSPASLGTGVEVRGSAYALTPRFDLAPRLPGRPLAPAVLQAMEDLFGARFSEVRIHTGPQPQSLGAAAFTLGTDLVFAPGRFCPETVQGRQLLAHELTHVVQQRSGRVRNTFGRGLALVHDPALEAEAQRMGERALRIGSTVVLPATPRGGSRLPPPAPRNRPLPTVAPLQARMARTPPAGSPHRPEPPAVLRDRIARVVQRSTSSGGSDLEHLLQEAQGAADLSVDVLEDRIQRITTALQQISLFDPRRPVLERAYHAFSAALGNRRAWQQHRQEMLTRVVREDQLVRTNIGINTVRRSEGSLTRNLGGPLTPEGNLTDPIQSLYSFMRTYGGAGLQGFHRISPEHLKAIRQALTKMAQDRASRSSRGPKFAMVAVDRRRLSSPQVMDLSDPSTEQRFSSYYGPKGSHSTKSFMKMYGQHKSEGVVAIEGEIPLKAIMGLRAFRDLTDEELEAMLQELLDLATDQAESITKPFKKYDEDRDPPPLGGTLMTF